MSINDAIIEVPVPDQILFEFHPEGDACDVIVRMDDGTVYTALFATFSYLHRQMQLSYELTRNMPDTKPVRYATIDTPHILVENLERETIEDTIDNLLSLDSFEGHFTLVTETENTNQATRTRSDGRRATQEVAAVVISDVLVVKD